MAHACRTLPPHQSTSARDNQIGIPSLPQQPLRAFRPLLRAKHISIAPPPHRPTRPPSARRIRFKIVLLVRLSLAHVFAHIFRAAPRPSERHSSLLHLPCRTHREPTIVLVLNGKKNQARFLRTDEGVVVSSQKTSFLAPLLSLACERAQGRKELFPCSPEARRHPPLQEVI